MAVGLEVAAQAPELSVTVKVANLWRVSCIGPGGGGAVASPGSTGSSSAARNRPSWCPRLRAPVRGRSVKVRGRLQQRDTRVVAEDDEFRVGDIYEDCAFHPCLCVEIEDDGPGAGFCLVGISLIDGTWPRSCSTRGCGPVPIPLDQVMGIKKGFARYVERRTAECAAAAGELPETGPAAGV